MARWVELLAAKAEDLSSIPSSHPSCPLTPTRRLNKYDVIKFLNCTAELLDNPVP